MTAPEPTEREREIAEALWWAHDKDTLSRHSIALARYRAEVVAAEREACARTLETGSFIEHAASPREKLAAAHALAAGVAAIRARG